MVMLSMLRGTVQGMGYTAPAAICGVVELVARLIVSRVATTVRGLYFAGPAAWVLTTLFLVALYPVLLRRLCRLGLLYVKDYQHCIIEQENNEKEEYDLSVLHGGVQIMAVNNVVVSWGKGRNRSPNLVPRCSRCSLRTRLTV